MGQALCTCAECGAAVRRDDGPLAAPVDAPKRISFTSGVGAVFALDFCNDCFAQALHSAQRRAELQREPLPKPEQEQ